MKPFQIKITSIISGILVITAGVLLFAFNANLLPLEYKPILFSWQMLLVSLGFVCLFSYHKRFFGLLLMLVGGFFLLPELDIEPLKFLQGNGWALALIIVGVFIIYNAVFNRRFRYKRLMMNNYHGKRKTHREFASSWQQNSPPNEPGYIYRDYVFGGSKEKLDIADFKGGEINCVFGGTQLDLSNSQLTEGVSNLKISAVFGGVVLIVPMDWKIEIHQEQVFGHFEDKRPNFGFEVNENKVLIINASSVFGGGEIKSKAQN